MQWAPDRICSVIHCKACSTIISETEMLFNVRHCDGIQFFDVQSAFHPVQIVFRIIHIQTEGFCFGIRVGHDRHPVEEKIFSTFDHGEAFRLEIETEFPVIDAGILGRETHDDGMKRQTVNWFVLNKILCSF